MCTSVTNFNSEIAIIIILSCFKERCATVPEIESDTGESKLVATSLVTDILEGYDARIKPRWNHLQSINVTLRPDLYMLLSVEEPQQSVCISIWINEEWEDELLFWSPREYKNITRVTLSHDSIWTPDTVLYNSIVMKDEKVRRLLNVQVDVVPERNTTSVRFRYPAILTFTCLLNMFYFPFDTQNCTLVMGSWTYDNSDIDYHFASQNVDIGQFIQNVAWDLISFTAERVVTKYPCCPESFTAIHLHLCLQRKPLYYIVNLIIPSLILSVISIFGLFTPSSSTGERTERVTLGITALLAISVLLLMVSDHMPSTSVSVPIIEWYLLSKIILISIGSLLTTVVIKINQKGLEGERLSKTSKRWGLWFSKILRVPIPKHFTVPKKCIQKLPIRMDKIKELEPLVLVSHQPPCYLKVVPNDSAMPPCTSGSEETLDMSIQERTIEQKDKQYAMVEWEWAASVFEKASCCVCLLILSLISCVILLKGFFIQRENIALN